MTRLVLLIALLAPLSACASTGPYAPPRESARDTHRAQELTREAADLVMTDPEKAERLLREALGADLFHGPAHNNLGVLRMNAGDWYGAATEFEWASRLMPGHPDPRLNLGLVLERAGKADDAIRSYATALEVYPGYLPTVQALARCQIRHDRADERTKGLLDEITLRGDPEWRSWARQQSDQNTQ